MSPVCLQMSGEAKESAGSDVMRQIKVGKAGGVAVGDEYDGGGGARHAGQLSKIIRT